MTTKYKRPSLKELKHHTYLNYFTIYTKKEKEIWQPFEDYSIEQVEEFANTAFYGYARLLGYSPVEFGKFEGSL